MEAAHIIACYVCVIVLTAGYLVAKTCLDPGLVGDESDVLTELIGKKKKSLDKSNIKFSISTYIALMIAFPLFFGVVSYILSQNSIFSVFVGVCGLFVPEGVAYIMKIKADKDYEERYARSLEQFASSLKAGMSISQAVEEVSENKFIHESIREKYRKMSTDLQMGVSISDAFFGFAKGSSGKDAKDVAVAIDIQNEVGGHEADVIMSIARDINDRIMLRHEIKSLFSGTSSMVIIMDFLPLVIMLFLCLTDKSYLSFYLASPFNLSIFIVLIAFCVTGSMINHKKLNRITKGI